MFESFMFLMIIVVFVLVIVALVSISSLRAEIQELKRREFQQHMWQQPMNQHPTHQQPTQPQQPPYYQVPQPTSAQAQQPVRQQPMPQQPVPEQQPAQYQQPQPQQQPAQYPPLQPQFQQVHAQLPYQSQLQPAQTSQPSMESILGKNIFGIVASILVFIGLVFLGFLIVPNLTDAIKVILMFVLSAALTVAGFLLNNRYSNNFTKSLLGTGCGAFFISILITHLYFQMINDIAAFSLLLVWMAASFLLARQTNSLLVGIIAHVGMVVSICAGYGVGLADNKLLLLMVYQFVSTAVIIIGNILCCKKMYRFGLFATLIMMLYASAVMWMSFLGWGASFSSDLPVPLISAAFLVQFLGASALSYLIFVSCVRVKEESSRHALQVANVLLWFAALLLDVTLLVGKLSIILGASNDTLLFGSYDSMLPALIVSLAVLLVAACAIMLLRLALSFDAALEKLTVITLGIFAALGLLTNASLMTVFGVDAPHLTWLIGLAILFMVAAQIQRNSTYAWTARIFLIIDYCAMLLGGFSELVDTGIALLAPAYLLLLVALSVLSFRQFDAEVRKDYRRVFVAVVFVASELALIAITYLSERSFTTDDYLIPALLVALLLVAGVMHFLKLDSPLIVYRVNEFTLFFGTAYLLLDSSSSTVRQVLLVIAALLCFVLIIERIRCYAAKASRANISDTVLPSAERSGDAWQNGAKMNPAVAGRDTAGEDALEVVGAIAFTAVFLALFNNLFDWFDGYYSLSLSCMFIALLFIALGFWSRARSLRLYGLALVIFCVLKLVTVDVAGLDTMMRVVAFIGGGLICLCISALYNFVAKRLDGGGSKPALERRPPR